MTLGVPYGIVGSTGRMGREIVAAAGDRPCLRVWGSGEECDASPRVIFDFSTKNALPRTLELCEAYHSALVIGTTALDKDDLEKIRASSGNFPVVQSFNFSIGVAVIAMMLRQFGPLLSDWDAEIAEAHHIHKKDAPSGTAILLRDALGRDVPMHSFRLGGLPGDHAAIFGNEGETISIAHHAISRSVFAIGAVKAAQFILNKQCGLFRFEDVVRG